MKNFFNFVKWRWINSETWEKTFALCVALILISPFFGQHMITVAMLSLVPILVLMLKWAIWDSFKSEYQAYMLSKQEKQE